MRVFLRLPALLVALAAVVALSGCSNSGDDDDARVRLLNVSSGYDSLDMYVTEDDEDDDELQAEAVAFGSLSEYSSFESGTYDVEFKKNGVSSTLQTLSDEKLADDSNATYVAYGAVGHFGIIEINEDADEPDDDGRTKLRVVNVAEAGDLDVYLTDSDVSLDDVSPTFSSVSGDSGLVETDSGEFRLRVTEAGDTDDVRLDVSSITLESEEVATLILSETDSGLLVDGALLPQEGSLTQFVNTKARVRAAVGLGGGSKATLSVGGVSLISSQGPGVISAYTDVDAGSASVTLSVDGTAVTVDALTLEAGNDYTVLLWTDSSGTHSTTLITDDNHEPTTSSDAKIRLLNGLSDSNVPATLYVSSYPFATETQVGAASDYSEVDVGEDLDIYVSNATTGDTLVSKELDLEASGVYTVLVFEKPQSGGSGTNVDMTLRQDR